MVSTEWLKRTGLFEDLQEPQLQILLSHALVETFPEGKTIFYQGEEANRLYILIEGTIDLTVKTGEKIDMMTSKIEKEGSIFGMPSLLEPFLYNVTATCLTPSKILVMKADDIRDYIEKEPQMGMKIMKKLASIYLNRLNEMRQGVSKLVKAFKSKVL